MSDREALPQQIARPKVVAVRLGHCRELVERPGNEHMVRPQVTPAQRQDGLVAILRSGKPALAKVERGAFVPRDRQIQAVGAGHSHADLQRTIQHNTGSVETSVLGLDRALVEKSGYGRRVHRRDGRVALCDGLLGQSPHVITGRESLSPHRLDPHVERLGASRDVVWRLP